MLSAFVRLTNRLLRHRFWLLNSVLLLLYLWTLTGQTRVAVTVNNGVCTAIVPGRTLQVECPELRAGSRVGLYLQNPEPEPEDVFVRAPLDWLAPHAAWNSAALFDASGHPQWANSFTQANLTGWEPLAGNWQTVAGELRASSEAATVLRSTPANGNFTFTAELRRPEDVAGLLLLEPDGERGLAFITSGASRRGMWWRWVEGKPDTPLMGIPFARPLVAQFQWLLRVVLRAHQGALLLLMAGWLLAKAGHFLRRNTVSPLPSRSPAPRQPLRWAVTAILLLVFAATLFIASDVLERIPHVQDSVTYLFQAQTLAGGRLWASAPPLPDFFEQEFLLVRGGRWFGKYPPGFPALLAVGVWLKLPWLINPMLATLTVPLLYALGAELYDRRTALLAVALGLTSPFFLFISGSTMAHPAELFWITLFLISWLRALRMESRQWAVVAGLALGMALLTRQLTAIAVAVPFVAATILRPAFSQQAGEQGRRRAGVKRFLPRSLTPLLPCGFHPPLVYYRRVDIWPRRWQQVIILGLAALPFLVLLLGYQWALTGSPWHDPRLLYWDYDTLGFGPDAGERANLLRVASFEGEQVIIWYHDPSQPPRGHTLERGLHNTGRNWQELEEHLFGWLPLFTLAFVWLAFLARRPAMADWLLLAVAAGPVAAHLFYWASGIMYGPRYYYPLLPAVLLLTGRGIQAAAARLSGKEGRIALAILVFLLVANNLILNMPHLVDAHRGYNFVSGRQQALVEATIPAEEKALVFVATPTKDWWQYGALFSANTPWLDGQIIYARDRGNAQNAQLMALYSDRAVYRLANKQLEQLR